MRIKKPILLLSCLLLFIIGHAQVSKTINVTTPGTLSTLLTSTELSTVTNLTVTGNINARDFKTMRDSMTVLAVLDMSGVNINTYYGSYGTAGSSNISYNTNEIPTKALSDKSRLKIVNMPTTISSIGDEAFSGCLGLTGILNIPTSVTSIGSYSFSNCQGLTGSLNIPSSVTTIGNGAFYYCSSLNGSLTIPPTIEIIGNSTFSNCQGLTGSLNIPSSVTSIGDNAFESCEGFTSLTIPSSVTSIGSSAFYDCYGLTGSLIIPSSVSIIKDGTFQNCGGLSGSLIIPSSVTTIGNGAFYYCSGFNSLTIPSSITQIDAYAFYYCYGLTKINAYSNKPSSIYLGGGAFSGIPIDKCYLHVPVGEKTLYAVADQWKSFTNIIEGYTTTLTISNPTVVTNKMVDGNTNAFVSKLGTLQGVDAADAGNVSLTVTASYDNASVGINKTITVVYTLSGSAANNYFAPVNYVITNAKISDYITLNALSTPTPGCEGSYMDLPYTLLSGTPTQYKITFNSPSLAALTQNEVYQTFSYNGTSGVLSFFIPYFTMDGTYQGTLKMNNELNVESPDYPFIFTVNVSADNIRTKFNTLVMFDNSSSRFAGYQWYKNNMEIAGATKQFYVDPAGLVGSYSLKLTTTDGSTLYSCPKVLNIPSGKAKVSTFPNPVKENESCTVQITGLTDDELIDTQLSVYNLQGICVYETSVVKSTTQFNLSQTGVYIGHVTTSGIDNVFKIIVSK